ncbi:MAG: hypothetical protein JO072_00920 [Parafilimonas sp.]|nr:hypothetical protein [Parafilimonas sp.]
MGNIAFTLCSINYLAQAKTLFESLRKTNPGWKFIIGLVDKNDKNADLSFLQCEIVEVEKIAIDGFKEMANRYAVIELLTSVKPFYIHWLFSQYKDAENVVYFDPDIMVFQPLTRLENSLQHYDIILTPHYTTPINDNCLPTELHVMQTGIFNLGFIALRRSENTFRMLSWWQDRLKEKCVIDLSRGLFVDQVWANLMPVCFDKVLIEKYPGYNMAHWNLHERMLSKKNNEYFVNDEPLVFFHFSHYSPAQPDSIAAHHDRFSFVTRPDLKEIYSEYNKALIQHNYFQLRPVKCYYMNNEKNKRRKREMETFLRTALPDKWKGRIKKMIGK